MTFTKGLSKELIERGIRVNAVAPGPVWTPLIAATMPAEEVSTFGESNPTGRPAQPAELAPAYVFLASADSRFVTGEVIGVTGGQAAALAVSPRQVVPSGPPWMLGVPTPSAPRRRPDEDPR